MKSLWKSIKPLESDHEYVVLASSIPPRDVSSTLRLFRGASAVRKQLAGTAGVAGFALLARPVRKQYATLSVWVDEPALTAFAQGDPHRRLMTDLAAEMAATQFIRWTIKGSDGRPSWSDALRRHLLMELQESTTCSYAVQDKVWVQGPDNAREFYAVLADAPVLMPTDGCCYTATAAVAVAAPTAERGCE